MIFWNDFDVRATKVLCDKCEKDISSQVYNELRRPWWRFWQRYNKPEHQRSSLGNYQKQWVWFWHGNRYVLMKFKEPKEHNLTLAELMNTKKNR